MTKTASKLIAPVAANLTPKDTLAQAAARAWLHAYGIDTSRYTKGGGDHPAMMTLPLAFEEFAIAERDADGE